MGVMIILVVIAIFFAFISWIADDSSSFFCIISAVLALVFLVAGIVVPLSIPAYGEPVLIGKSEIREIKITVDENNELVFTFTMDGEKQTLSDEKFKIVAIEDVQMGHDEYVKIYNQWPIRNFISISLEHPILTTYEFHIHEDVDSKTFERQ